MFIAYVTTITPGRQSRYGTTEYPGHSACKWIVVMNLSEPFIRRPVMLTLSVIVAPLGMVVVGGLIVSQFTTLYITAVT